MIMILLGIATFLISTVCWFLTNYQPLTPNKSWRRRSIAVRLHEDETYKNTIGRSIALLGANRTNTNIAITFGFLIGILFIVAGLDPTPHQQSYEFKFEPNFKLIGISLVTSVILVGVPMLQWVKNARDSAGNTKRNGNKAFFVTRFFAFWHRIRRGLWVLVTLLNLAVIFISLI